MVDDRRDLHGDGAPPRSRAGACRPGRRRARRAGASRAPRASVSSVGCRTRTRASFCCEIREREVEPVRQRRRHDAALAEPGRGSEPGEDETAREGTAGVGAPVDEPRRDQLDRDELAAAQVRGQLAVDVRRRVRLQGSELERRKAAVLPGHDGAYRHDPGTGGEGQPAVERDADERRTRGRRHVRHERRARLVGEAAAPAVQLPDLGRGQPRAR